MNLTPRLDESIKLASRLHRNQTRKDSERTPYISHLVAVASLISQATEDEDIIIAGLMHDSIEDVENYSYEKLVEDCGEKVATIVKGVTETKEYSQVEDRELRWLKIREMYLENLKLSQKESSLVAVADKIHNNESFLLDMEREGDIFLKRFGASMRNKLWFNEASLEVVKEKLGADHILVKRFESSIEKFRKLVENYEK